MFGTYHFEVIAYSRVADILSRTSRAGIMWNPIGQTSVFIQMAMAGIVQDQFIFRLQLPDQIIEGTNNIIPGRLLIQQEEAIRQLIAFLN